MEITAQFSPADQISADWLVIALWQKEKFDNNLAALDEKLNGLLAELVESSDLTGKTGECVPLLHCPALLANRILAIGLGEKSKADFSTLDSAAAIAARHITEKESNSVVLQLPHPPEGLTWRDVTVAMTAGFYQGCEDSGIRRSKQDRFAPKEIQIVPAGDASRQEVNAVLESAVIQAKAVSLARELVNLPANELYPESFATRAQDVAQKTGVEITVFDEKKLAEEKMGSLLGVGQGSDRPSRLAVLRYNGKPGGKTLALVGKGVTFDSGGLSLKPSDSMLDMKCDMAGAATVLAAVQAIAELKLPVNILGVLPMVENMPSAKAFKLGDVLRARNGKTIEIHNTDAEGRLILADALAYAVDQKADHIVDLATLTGACMVALGTEVTGLMSNDDKWTEQVQQAAKRAGELVWPLPMFAHYGEMIKSKVADIKNTGGTRWAGAITAAKFLEEFVGETPWVHLDIAGPAFAEDDNAKRSAGGTGAMVRTLVELAKNYT